jgi:glycosyltransferase involved in cell wall biosynthesis
VNTNQEQRAPGNDDGHASAALNQTRVLTVLPDFPSPATTGLHLRHLGNLELVHRLGCYSAVLYFTTEERQPPPVESTPLPRICDEVRHGGRRFPHANFSTASLVLHKADFLLRGALGWTGKRYPFSMSYDRIGAEKIILAEAQRVKADFVILPSFMLHYARNLAAHGFRVIADAIDVLTDLTSRFLASYASHPVNRVTLYANYLASRTQERVFLPYCCEVWATSQAEAETLARIAPTVNVVVVANSLDEEAFPPSAFNDGESVGFIGTYSSRPNLDAVLFLAEEVFPAVLGEHPDARLKLAGANLPSAEEARLRELRYVDLLGAVADSAELYNQCRVIALPVFVRGGVPLKIVEAMAREKAVVACPELVAGLAVQDRYDLLVSDGAGFASAISLLLSNDDLCRCLARNGRNTFLRNWSWSHAEEVLQRSSVLTSSLSEEVRG